MRYLINLSYNGNKFYYGYHTCNYRSEGQDLGFAVRRVCIRGIAYGNFQG